ncbi:hypothetical protein [Streptomyces sp. NBC_01446]|uniref:hypothetical protein n=1 Tax=Streptomyces sp. NBC_01446 TaxID=2903870 RepID=UPI002254254D|nr:hypothetical protein [Streptomyces sp. NBC_01446]MCX4643184.1 hypothetical protein [Streptomyces sp. NBC_01446]
MIRIVTTPRLESLEYASRTAREHVREVAGSANEAFGEHVRELYAVTDRAERAEATTDEVGAILKRAMEELAAAQQELLLKDIEIRRLREELEGELVEGQTLTLLSHYGEPHTVYASREEAEADTATQGVPTDAWVPASGRPAPDVRWRCEAFICDAASNGFRRVFMTSPEPVGGAA